MVNHARTLLLNCAAKVAAAPAPAYYLREWIDPEFVPVTIPQSLRTVRDVLFDSNPDELMLNYRARQYLKCLHASELSEYVTKLDSRITYYFDHFSFFKPLFFWTPYNHGGTSVKATDFSLVGDYAEPTTGRLHRRWSIYFNSSGTYTATNDFSGNSLDGSVNYLQGRSTPLALPDTSIQVTVSELAESVDNNNQARVQLDVITEPRNTLSDVLVRLQQLPAEVMSQLFSDYSSIEPWPTFRSCFEKHYNPIMRLSAAVLAYIYRLEQIR
jgi:hypothetical protein